MPSTEAHLDYRADVDGLRAVAILAVLIYHAFPGALPGGFVGVDIFFVISGFLITSLILSAQQGRGFSILDFYGRRVRRIFPALILVLAFSLVMGWRVLLANEYGQLAVHVMGGAGFVSNIVLWSESGYFDRAAEVKPLLHLWSLAIEEQFYLLWPAWMVLLARRPAWRMPATLMVLLASFALNLYGVQHKPIANFYLPFTRFWELMIGGLLAQGLRQGTARLARGAELRAWLGTGMVVAALGLVDRTKAFPGAWALLPAVGAALLISAGPTAWLNRHLLSSRGLVAVGLISYPLYLWHWPLLSFARVVFGEVPPAAVRGTAVALALLLAWATYRWVERPIRRGSVPQALTLLAGLMVAVFAAAWLVAACEGVMSRRVNSSFERSYFTDVFAGSRSSDDSCMTKLGLQPLPEEVCQASTARPQTLFVGDSHAMALYSSVFAGQTALDALLIAAHSCALYPNLDYDKRHVFADVANDCRSIARKVLDVAARLPSIKTVVIANFSRPLVGSSEFDWRGPAGPLGVEQAFLAGHGAMIEALQALGKRVVFVIDVPILPHNPADCVRRLPFVQPVGCDISRPAYERASRPYLEAVSALQAQHPALKLFDAARMVCDGARCSALDGRHFMYHDFHHLSAYGSRRTLAAMAELGLLGVPFAASP